jgi:hypothetical protein
MSRASGLAGFSTSISPPSNLSVGVVTATSLTVSQSAPTDGILAKLVNPANASGSEAGIRLQHNNTTQLQCDLVTFRSGANAGLDFNIKLSDSAGTPQTRFTILEGGNVGIGTASPLVQLQVQNGASSCLIRTISSPSSIAGIDFGDTDDNDIGGVRYDNNVDALSWRTNNAERVRIDSSGNMGIGGAPAAGRRVDVTGALPAASGFSIPYSLRGTIPSAATTAAYIFYSNPTTEAASFTLPFLYHFFANPSPFGAGSTVTNQYGFVANNTLTGATNNYGFYGNIDSGANRWNFYAGGTAANRFNGNVLIGGTIQPASATLALCLSNGTAPTGSITDGVVLYAEDVSASSELKVRDEAGNVTTLSPHNFDLIPDGPSEEMAWSYYSERDGKRINVDMLKAIRLLEQISGEKLVYSS